MKPKKLEPPFALKYIEDGETKEHVLSEADLRRYLKQMINTMAEYDLYALMGFIEGGLSNRERGRRSADGTNDLRAERAERRALAVAKVAPSYSHISSKRRRCELIADHKDVKLANGGKAPSYKTIEADLRKLERR